MPVADFIPKLKSRLTAPLPGLDAQMQMAPEVRGKELFVPPNARRGAVMLLLYPYAGQWRIPFIRRTDDGRVHGGQVSLPGGRKDPEDPDFTVTALRETEEEIGVPRDDIEILGSLTELYIPPSNFVVYPRVGLVSQRPRFVPEPKEVQDVIEINLQEFLDPRKQGLHTVDVFGGHMIEAPGYTVGQEHLIWGGTAMMIAEFVQLVSELLADGN